MRLHRVILAAGAADLVAASPVNTDGPLSEQQIINAVMNTPHILPPRGKSGDVIKCAVAKLGSI